MWKYLIWIIQNLVYVFFLWMYSLCLDLRIKSENIVNILVL